MGNCSFRPRCLGRLQPPGGPAPPCLAPLILTHSRPHAGPAQMRSRVLYHPDASPLLQCHLLWCPHKTPSTSHLSPGPVSAPALRRGPYLGTNVLPEAAGPEHGRGAPHKCPITWHPEPQLRGPVAGGRHSAGPSPCSQFFPPNRSGHSQRYVLHLLTQVPPF